MSFFLHLKPTWICSGSLHMMLWFLRSLTKFLLEVHYTKTLLSFFDFITTFFFYINSKYIIVSSEVFILIKSFSRSTKLSGTIKQKDKDDQFWCPSGSER